MNKNQDNEIRHSRNVLHEKEKYEQKEFNNKEKIMQNYITFYWNRKKKEQMKKSKYLHNKEKFGEKMNKLEEIERKKEKSRENLIKKLKKIEDNQIRIQKDNMKKFKILKDKRDKFFQICKENKKNLDKLIVDEKDNILEYQENILSRPNLIEQRYNLKKEVATEKVILHQMTFEKNLKPFYKKLEEIKSNSIIKKSLSQRRKIFKNLKRAEAEAKKKEEEEKLLNKML